MPIGGSAPKFSNFPQSALPTGATAMPVRDVYEVTPRMLIESTLFSNTKEKSRKGDQLECRRVNTRDGRKVSQNATCHGDIGASVAFLTAKNSRKAVFFFSSPATATAASGSGPATSSRATRIFRETAGSLIKVKCLRAECANLVTPVTR